MGKTPGGQNQKERMALKAINITYFIASVFLIAIIFILFRFFSLFKSPTNDCEIEKKLAFKGVVSEIRLDTLNRSQKFIILSNNIKVIPPFTYGLWNEVNIGDSIVKIPNSLNYTIYRGPNFTEVKELLWDKKCN